MLPWLRVAVNINWLRYTALAVLLCRYVNSAVEASWLSPLPKHACYSCMSFEYKRLWQFLMQSYYPPRNFTPWCDRPDGGHGRVAVDMCEDVCVTIVETEEIGGMQMRHRYMRGCIDRLFLFGLDPRVRGLLVKDATMKFGGVADPDDGELGNQRATSVQYGPLMNRRSVFFNNDDQPAGACRRINRQLLLPEHARDSNFRSSALHMTSATRRRRRRRRRTRHYKRRKLYWYEKSRPSQLSRVDDMVIICSCMGDNCNNSPAVKLQLVAHATTLHSHCATVILLPIVLFTLLFGL